MTTDQTTSPLAQPIVALVDVASESDAVDKDKVNGFFIFFYFYHENLIFLFF